MDTFSKPAVVATQLVLYMNDTLYISYSDGSSLQLSPCGAAFTHHHAIDSQAHTLHGMRSIQQRTQFVTSEYRHKLDEAIDFRNRFASRPFVSENLHAESSNLVSDVIVLEAVWPHDHKNAHIEYLSDQQIQLRAINRSAVLTLGANKQHFTVRYLVQIQMEAPSSVWISSHYSILSYPECWNHPIKLLLLAAEKSKPQVQFNLDITSEDTDSNNTENCQHQQESNKSGTETEQHKTEPNKVGDHTRDGTSDTPPCEAEATVITVLPQALPLNCPSQHLHRWQKATDTQTHGKIKIFCSNAIIYRFLWGPPCIEIYPGDGSTLRATSSAAHFFTHYIMVNEQYAERMYSVDNPPIRTHGVEYCIAKLITTAARLLHQFTEDNLDLLFTDTEGCWQIATSSMPLSRTTHTPVTVIEQCVVDGLGRFTAFNNGRIRVVFTDRTCMDMKVVATPTSTAKEFNDLIEPACKLLLPNGRYHNVDARHPADYKSYIDCGLDWVRWVTTPAASRETFYKGTVHDPDTHRSVVTELKKIQCFNYITDNALPHLSPREPVESSKLVESPKCAQTTGFQEDFTPDMVQQIIKQNSSIVADIEEILHK